VGAADLSHEAFPVMSALTPFQTFVQQFLGARHACVLSTTHGPDQSYTDDRTLSPTPAGADRRARIGRYRAPGRFN
jgi:hypothetical protein